MVGIDPTTISAILITHEHSDHIGGVGVIARRYQLPVYVNFHTATYLKGIANLQHFETGQDFYIGSTHIHPLAIAHDAVDPVGFVIREEGRGGESAECFAQVTDCGRITDLVIQSLKSAQAVVVEANHDEELLLASHYPWEVKQRIRSNRGHLSNTKAATLLSAALHKDLRTVVLAHLSEQCNLPELAIGAVQRGWHELITSQPDYGDPLPELVAASQHEPTLFL
jgi:phosphoribosyl 1,2-cyclic phosphodiesterase